ncbi:unnamed protein product [Closterium sp. NIES-53]
MCYDVVATGVTQGVAEVGTVLVCSNLVEGALEVILGLRARWEGALAKLTRTPRQQRSSSGGPSSSSHSRDNHSSRDHSSRDRNSSWDSRSSRDSRSGRYSSSPSSGDLVDQGALGVAVARPAGSLVVLFLLFARTLSRLGYVAVSPVAAFTLRDSVSDSLPVASVGAYASSLGVCEATSPGAPLVEASLSFTLDSGASQCFFRDYTTLTSLPASVSVSLADPTSGPVVACSSTTLLCPAVPSGVLTGLHIPLFSRNLVGVGYLQDRHVDIWFPPCEREGTCVDGDSYAPLATFAREPGHSGLYILHTQSPQVVSSGLVAASGQVAASCSCRSLVHPTVLWHHCLSHPSLPCLRSMASQRLVSGLPRVLELLPRSPMPPCTPCVKGQLRATPHSSSLRPAPVPFQTLHLDSWALPESPQQNGVAERRIGLVMEIVRTSMIHAHAPHFLWPYAVRYDAHQLNLWPRVVKKQESMN